MTGARNPQKSFGNLVFIALRWIAALAVLALLLHFFPLAPLRSALAHVPLTRFLAILLLYLLGHAAGIVKWRMVVNAAGAELSLAASAQCYAGGLFVPFKDATSGHETYGGGRYLLDTIKSADLGSDAATGTVVLDFNYAYHPSCTYDPRWVCPLAPPDSRLTIPIRAGERLP